MNNILSFKNITVSDNFKIVNNTDFYCEQDCTADITLSLQCMLMNKEQKNNPLKISAIVYRRINPKEADKEAQYIISNINIDNDKSIDIPLVAELNKNDYINFTTEGENIELGGLSFMNTQLTSTKLIINSFTV
jgi:hypothetical protein